MTTRSRTALSCSLAALSVALLAGLPACSASARKQAEQQVRDGIDREAIAARLTEQGDRARLRGDRDRAIELYQEALDYSARYHDTWNNLGLLYLERNQEGDLGRAINHFVQAGVLDPTDPRPPTNAGIAYLQGGYASEAMDLFHEALRIQPSYLPALRGAIKSADLLATAQYEDLERVKRALLAETDTQWREYFERQRFLIESRLRSLNERTGSSTSSAGTP